MGIARATGERMGWSRDDWPAARLSWEITTRRIESDLIPCLFNFWSIISLAKGLNFIG